MNKKAQKLVYIMHANALTKAESLRDAILLQTPNVEIEIGEISTVLAVHAGEDTLAVLWYVP